MAETTVLKSKASSSYVRNAPQFGNTAIPGHSALQGGGNVLPVVHNAPQAGTNSRVAGVLPVVQVNMTAGGPQVTNPHQAQPPPPRSTVGRSQSNAGGLPVVQVRMTASGPQVQSSARSSDHGATAQQWSRATADRQAQFIAPYTMPVPNTAALSTETVVVPSLSSDQLLLCRHLVAAYLTTENSSDHDPLEPVSSGALLASSTIDAIDQMMLTMAEAEAIAATEPAPVQVQVPVPPQPRHRMVVPQRTVVASNRSAQVTAAATPRRVPRPAHAQPPTVVQPTVAQGRPIIDVPATGEMPPDLAEMTAAHIDSAQP